MKVSVSLMLLFYELYSTFFFFCSFTVVQFALNKMFGEM